MAILAGALADWPTSRATHLYLEYSAMSTPSDALYHIPKAQIDITRFVWTGLGLFMMIVLLSTWAATEYAAWALGYTAALGKPMIPPLLYNPFDILI